MTYEFEYRALLKSAGGNFDVNLIHNMYRTIVRKKLNQMASFSFRGYSLDATQKSRLIEGNELIIIYNNKNILKGMIREIHKDEEMDEWEIIGDGSEVKLFNRESQDRTQWDNTAANTIVSSLISGIMNAGTINAADAIGFRAEYGNILDRLVQLAKITNYDWYVSQGIAPTYTDAFNFLSYRGQLTPAVENFKIGVGVGADIYRIRDFDRIANSIAVMGWGDGPLQLKSTVDACTTNLTYLNGALTAAATTITVDDTSLFSASGNVWVGMEKISYTGKTATTFTGCTRGVSGGLKAYAHSDNILVRDAQYTAAAPQTGSSIQVNGSKQKTFPQLDIIDQDTLDRLAQRLIGEYKDSVERGWAILSLDDFTTAADLGDTISIEERDTTAKTNYRLLGIEYNQDTLEIKIDFGSIKDYFLEDLARMKKELAVNNIYGAGAPNSDESLMTDNVEQSFSLKHPFKIPDNVIAVGELSIDIDLYKFRDYSALAAAAGAHNHAFGVQPKTYNTLNDRHILAAGPAGDANIYSDISQSDTIPNSAATNHTHILNFGIQEDTTTLSSIQLELWLDGVKLTDTNCPALASVTGWDAVNDRLAGYSSYYGVNISNYTGVAKWTPGQRYELEIRSVNASAHRCKIISKLSKICFIKGVKTVTG